MSDLQTKTQGTATAAAKPGPSAFARNAERLALPAAMILLIVVFGILRPDTFLTGINFTNILGAQAMLLVLALAAMLPTMTGDFDLSLGSIMGLSSAVVAVCNVRLEWGIIESVLAGLVVAVVAGALNALFVVTFDTNPLIITLGMGTVLTGVIFFVLNSTTVAGVDIALSQAVYSTRFFGISIAFVYALVLTAIIWYVTTFTPLGLRSAFVGQSRDVARLSGINVSRVRWGGFMLGGLLAGFAGVILTGMTGSADPTASGAFLLPAYAAVFLGATTVQPGRFNAIGTLIAVYFIAIGVNGLQVLGAQNYVQQLFYGAALVIAVVVSRRLRRS